MVGVYLKPIFQAILYLAILVGFSCKKVQPEPEEEIRIAFMADVHLLDVYGTLRDTGYSGIKNPKSGEQVLIRTMQAQLHSTRLFNENYFAFRAALDDAAERGIKLVALPGDFSDDGQPLNIRGLDRILNEYSEKKGMSFFLTTGNHDPKRPFDIPAGKSDFLGIGGKAQPIMSQGRVYRPNPITEHPTILSEDVRAFGYRGIVNGLNDYGFFPKKKYRYWETPFSKYAYNDYSLDKAKEAAHLENRCYTMPGSKTPVPDVSYLVEPVDGLWLLALDANVYVPKSGPEEFEGAGIGYNQVLEHKEYLLEWSSKVAEEAKKFGKTLIAFSHYPMVDFNDGASEEIAELLGKNAIQAHRIPNKKVGEVFADAGIKVHIGGHMHLNDTGSFTSESGKTLVNIQAPSLAAYKPAYKIATIHPDNEVHVETVPLNSVPDFDRFFQLYRQEYQFLESQKSDTVWNEEVLASKNYVEYTNWHLKELVRLRFLPEDWPSGLQNLFLELDGAQFLILSNTEDTFSKKDLKKVLAGDTGSFLWQAARKRVQERLIKEGFKLDDFRNWEGFDLIYDFYRLRNADQLAVEDIGKDRLSQYGALVESLKDNHVNPNFSQLWLFGRIFQKQWEGEPATDFTIQLKDGRVIAD